MLYIQGIELDPASREEMLPGFDPEFPYISTCAQLDRYPHPAIPWHWHRAVELFYIESGCLEYTTPHGTFTFPAGSGGFVNSNTLHATFIRSFGSPSRQLLHIFEPALLFGGAGNRMAQKYLLPMTASSVELIPIYPEDPVRTALLEDIRAAFSLSPAEHGYELFLREALVKIWLELLSLAAPEQTAACRAGDAQIKALMVFIHEHLSAPLSVEQLAREVHISKRACFRLFRENLHMTPLEYIRGVRLREACRLLASTQDSITHIAGRCGLGSSSYFGCVFREQFGCSPSQYRQKWHDPDSLRQN